MPVRLLVLALMAVAAPAQSSSPVFRQVDEMVATLSEITGWKVQRKIPSEMLGKESFRRFVESRMKQVSSDRQLRVEELTLKMFGFVPQDFNLARETVDLVSEQAAAFYDYNRKRLFILDSTAEGAEQQVALVHELAHALADQHHRLGKYLRRGSPDDDAATARQAVMEGQATWLTWAYVSRRNGGKAEVLPSMLDRVTSSAGAGGAEFPVFSGAPLYLRESLVFPYNQGMRFQDALYRRLGQPSFDAVFTRPPLSTQQILHPDDYIAGKKPSEPVPPALGAGAAHFRLLAEGSLGEFDHSVLLRQYINEKDGTAAATHWRGGSYRLYEHKRGKYPALAYISEWDSPESARAFFTLYQRVLRGKWKKMEALVQTSGEVSGTGDTGRFRLWMSGSTVLSTEGLR